MSKETQASKENELLAAVHEGNWNAYRILFKRYYPVLCAYGNRFVSLEEAEEISQDILLWVWENRENINILRSLSNYLLSMMYHRSVVWCGHILLFLSVFLIFNAAMRQGNPFARA